jgi:DNA-directed RNA polymerase subunit RPC12/RpoP
MVHKQPIWLSKYQIQKGQHLSPQTQFKKTKEKVNRNCVICGKPFETYESQRKKCCSKECGYKAIQGCNHPRWKGGIAKTNQKLRTTQEYRKWRMKVLVKADFRCAGCGQENSWEAHHIKSFAENPELRCDADNGECLCNLCHNKTKKGVEIKW